MTLIYYAPMVYNAAVHAEGSGLFLPQPISGWKETPQWRNSLAVVPGCAGQLLLDQKRDSISIEIEGRILGFDGAGPYARTDALTRGGMLALRAALESALEGPFTLWRYSDRYWAQCIAESLPIVYPAGPDGQVGYSLRVLCLDPVEVTGQSNGALSVFPYSPLVYDMEGSVSGGNPVTTRNGQTVSYAFLGVQATMSAGQEVVIPTPSGTGLWAVKRLAVLSASGVVGTGSTVVTLGSAGIGGGGSTMSVTMAHTVTTGSNTTGFSVAQGSNLYLWVAAGGIHADMQVMVQYEQG